MTRSALKKLVEAVIDRLPENGYQHATDSGMPVKSEIDPLNDPIVKEANDQEVLKQMIGISKEAGFESITAAVSYAVRAKDTIEKIRGLLK